MFPMYVTTWYIRDIFKRLEIIVKIKTIKKMRRLIDDKKTVSF